MRRFLYIGLLLDLGLNTRVVSGWALSISLLGQFASSPRDPGIAKNDRSLLMGLPVSFETQSARLPDGPN